jgi:beta-xylosidase
MALAVVALLAGAAQGAAPAPPAIAAIEPGPARIHADFPDPFLLSVEGGVLAFATNSGRVNVQMAHSADLKQWRRLKDDALPELPGWAIKGFTWAPEVLAIPTATGPVYLLYFTARHRASGLQCIGAAAARAPRGPYASTPPEPLVCQNDSGGSIDASPFRDADGALYLHFKNDGNHVGKPSHIYAQRLSGDGLRLTGPRVRLLTNDAPWEAHVIEAPTMVRRGGAYVMLFSANDYGWPAKLRFSPYAIGAAACAGPMGPCTDLPENPLLASRMSAPGGCVSGPGHQALLDYGGESWIAYHAWEATPDCRPGGPRRRMHIGRVIWNDVDDAAAARDR